MAQFGGSAAKTKSWVTGLIRAGVSIIILSVILSFASIGELLDRMRQVSPMLWIIVLAGFISGHAISAAKWRWMIGGGISYRQALKAHFAGLAANLLLPGVAGGDIVRAGIVMKDSDRKTALAIGSLGDRLIDTGSLVVIAAAGALWLGARAGVHPAGLALIAAGVIAGAVLGIILMNPMTNVARKLAPAGKFGNFIRSASDAVEELSHRRGALIGCAVMSVLVQLAFSFMNAAIAKNMGLGTSFAAWTFAWPLAKLVATLPISFGGLGVREASLAGLMTPLGYDATGIVAASLVWQSIQFSTGAIGALIQTVNLRRRETAAEPNSG